MAASPVVIIAATAAELAADVAGRVVATLTAAQAARGYATVALTGGGILEAVFGAVAVSPARADCAGAGVAG